MPMSIKSMTGDSSKFEPTLHNYRSVNNEPAEEYNEHKYLMTDESDRVPNYELISSSFRRITSSKMSQPIINRKPITQHGAVKAVNLFGPLLKDVAYVNENESSAVRQPIEDHFFANFDIIKSRTESRIHSTHLNSSQNFGDNKNEMMHVINRNPSFYDSGSISTKNGTAEQKKRSNFQIL